MRDAFALVLCTSFLAAPVSAQGPSPEQRRQALEHFRSGVHLMSEEAFEGAVRELRAATRLAARFVLAQYELGRSLMALGRYPEAVTAFTTCRDVILSLDAQELLLADELAESARFEDPYAHLQNESIPLGQLGQLRTRQRLRAQSAQSGQGEVRVPGEVYLALGSAHYHQGQLAEAEDAYRLAIGEDPGLGAAHNNLAAICMATGRLDEARREIEAAEANGFVVSGQFKKDLEQATARRTE